MTRRLLPLTHGARRRRFGAFRFQHAPTPSNPEHVVIEPGWAEANLVSIYVPQIHRMVTCHAKAERALLEVWREWERLGYLGAGIGDPRGLVQTYNGMWVPRFKRQPGTPSQRLARCRTLGAASLSNHSWGTAFDINARIWPLGKAVPADAPYRALIPAANRLGWFCGADYRTRPDGMHWEYVGNDAPTAHTHRQF